MVERLGEMGKGIKESGFRKGEERDRERRKRQKDNLKRRRA